MGNECKNYSERIAVSKLNKRLIRKECQIEFLKNNPHFKDIRITDNMIITALIKTYLGVFSFDGIENELNDKPKHKR